MGQEVCAAWGVDGEGAWSCSKQNIVAKGLCNAHYVQTKRTPGVSLKRLSAGVPLPTECGTYRCPRKPYARGLCRTCWGESTGRDLRSRPTKVGPAPPVARECELCQIKCEVSEFKGGKSRFCKKCHRVKHRLRKHGIRASEVAEVLQRAGTGCGLCEETCEVFHVDHDHSCCPGEFGCVNCVRGFICANCNINLVPGYEGLPTVFQTWPWLNEYLQRRPIRDMRNKAASAA